MGREICGDCGKPFKQNGRCECHYNDWTTTVPTEPGWYWWRPDAKTKPVPCHIVETEHGLMFRRFLDFRYGLIAHADGLWFGPFTPPPFGELPEVPRG